MIHHERGVEVTLSATQTAFVEKYYSMAKSAADVLGISPKIVLSQWALESAWGTAPMVKGYNLAGIMATGGNFPAQYTSFIAFLRDYVHWMKELNPLILHAPTSVVINVYDVFEGTKWNPNPDYAKKIASVLPTVNEVMYVLGKKYISQIVGIVQMIAEGGLL